MREPNRALEAALLTAGYTWTDYTPPSVRGMVTVFVVSDRRFTVLDAKFAPTVYRCMGYGRDVLRGWCIHLQLRKRQL